MEPTLDEYRRLEALKLAIEASVTIDPDVIVTSAGTFEAYLRGDDA